MQYTSFIKKAISRGLLGLAFLFFFTVGVFYFIYTENEEIKEMRGVLLKEQTSIAMTGKTIADSKHGTTTGLTLFALPYVEE